MGEPILIDQLAGDIWNIYVSDEQKSEDRIERFLESRLGTLSVNEQNEMLARLIDEFTDIPDSETRDLLDNNRVMGHVFSLLLGKDVSSSRLSTSEMIQKLAESLNTIFDSMNLLIGTINKTLYGKPPGKKFDDKTIRYVIGSHIKGGENPASIGDHLKQIRQAFLTSQQAFKDSVRSTLARVLDEIDPTTLDDESGGGFSLGPFRRAKSHELYKSKYSRIKKWFESDKFMEDFLREFEKNCRALKKE